MFILLQHGGADIGDEYKPFIQDIKLIQRPPEYYKFIYEELKAKRLHAYSLFWNCFVLYKIRYH